MSRGGASQGEFELCLKVYGIGHSNTRMHHARMHTFEYTIYLLNILIENLHSPHATADSTQSIQWVLGTSDTALWCYFRNKTNARKTTSKPKICTRPSCSRFLCIHEHRTAEFGSIPEYLSGCLCSRICYSISTASCDLMAHESIVR